MTTNYNEVERRTNQWRCPRCLTYNKIWDKKCLECQMTFPGRS